MDWITSVREIKKAQENNQLVIFVGAGVSKNSGVPTWWELIKKIAIEIGYDKCINCNEKKDNCPNNECKKRYDFTQEELLRIPEYYYQHYKGECEKYYNLIQDTLRGGSGSNLIDDEIFNLLPHHIITTNYDSLLEDSMAINSRLYTVVAKDSDLLSKASEHYIIKMHGDLNSPETIVLKESDYIDYEQNHPLISTFIRALLVNHTFVFLGYSLNDYNLNLIIGWINYFRKFHGIERCPSNYLIGSKSATLFEESRLKDKNIYVVDTSLLPDTILEKINISDSFNNPIGRKLLAYLKCISDEKFIQEYIPLEERLIEKYQPLQSYKKISFQDLIAVHPFGRTKFLDTELVVYEKTWFDKIGKILENVNSPVVETFRRAGITAIHFFGEDAHIVIPETYEPIDKIFALYLENDYIKLNEEMVSCKNPIQKLYYYHLLGRSKEELKVLIDEISENMSSEDYVSVVLHKTRTRAALLTLFDRQEEKTFELERIFDTALPKYREAISFLKMLFDSMAKNMYQMEKALGKHEERYDYKNRTTYFDHAFMNLWEIKSYAYDYYFFFIENGIPIHYFSNPKEYLSYYLKAILCTYAPTKQNSNDMEIPISRGVHRYVLGEVELDMFVKCANPKSLQTWIRKYSVQELKIDEDINVVKKFVNLCNSFVKFRIKYWTNQIKNFSFILCLINLNEKQKKEIFWIITNVMEELASLAPQANEEIFEAVEHIVRHMNIGNSPEEYAKFINVITDEKVYLVIINRYASKLQYILRKLGKFLTPEIRKKLENECDAIEDEMALCKKMYNLRFLISREKSRKFFNDHSDMLAIEQIFNLLIEGLLDYSEKLWIKFVDKIKAEDRARKKNPGMRTYPDWLMVTLEYSLLLKLLKFPIKLEMLKPYVEYSEHLLFMLNPSEFDYSKVDISNYMWQNLIYSKGYKKYFVDHKDKLLTEQLKDIFALGVDTVDQQKIVYGILLEDDEIQGY